MTDPELREDQEKATGKPLKKKAEPKRKWTNIGHDRTNICPLSPAKTQTGRVVVMADEDTGEYLGALIDGGRAPAEGDWIKLFRVAALIFAQDLEFGAESRTLMFLIGNIQFGNFVATSATLIAEDLGINRKTVARIVNHLLDQGILQRATLKGMKGYRFNPNLAFKGKPMLRGLQVHEWNRRLLDTREARERAEAELEAAFAASRGTS